MTSDSTPRDPSSAPYSAAALLSLARPANVAIAFFGVLAAGVIAGGRHAPVRDILLAAVSAVFLGAAGNVINDMRDVAIDRINKPRRALASGAATMAQARLLFALSAGLGVAFAAALAAPAFIAACAGLALMVLYSVWLKRIALVGNLAVGVATGLAFVMGAAAAGDTAAGLVPAGFACMFNFAREILKDIEDMPGDRACGIRTWPIARGERAALAAATAALALTMIATVVPWAAGVYGDAYLWIVVAGVDCVLPVALVMAWRDRSRESIARVCVLLKIDMPVGIVAILVGAWRG